MDTIDSIFDKINFEKAASKINIDFQNIEYIIGFALPDDYKYYLVTYDGFEGFIGNEYLRIWDLESVLKLNKDYNIDILPNVVAIGTNGGGEFIGIEFKENSCRVILCPFIDVGTENFITIGDSFTDMLTRLDNGYEWFN